MKSLSLSLSALLFGAICDLRFDENLCIKGPKSDQDFVWFYTLGI